MGSQRRSAPRGCRSASACPPATPRWTSSPSAMPSAKGKAAEMTSPAHTTANVLLDQRASGPHCAADDDSECEGRSGNRRDRERLDPEEAGQRVVEDAVRDEAVAPSVPEVVPELEAVVEEDGPLVDMRSQIVAWRPEPDQECCERGGGAGGEHRLAQEKGRAVHVARNPTRTSGLLSSARTTLSPMRGAIAAGHRLTAEAGAEILAEGGNAVDACLAAAFASWVSESTLTGPGGGGFMLVHRARDRSTRLLDFFVAIPGLGLGEGKARGDGTDRRRLRGRVDAGLQDRGRLVRGSRSSRTASRPRTARTARCRGRA